MSNSNRPIAAIATAIGEAGISVIRMSGNRIDDLFKQIWKGKPVSSLPDRSAVFGRIVDRGQMIDEVVVTVFRAPASYTGEDVIEVSCHGGYMNTGRVLEAVLRAGFSPAEPGEFTHRAFLNGKLDLTQAEAVADLIHARSEAERDNAARQLEGGLGGAMRAFRQQLIDFTALIELELDFSEEDVEFARREQLLALLDDIRRQADDLVATYRAGALVRDGVQTAIAGLPNAGKSTLLNALLQRDRAIVSPVAGTTRDTIEAEWSHGGLRFILIDTAGIRHTADMIEAIGVERSREALQKADVIILLADGGDPAQTRARVLAETGLSATDNRVLFVRNKADLSYPGPVGETPDVAISARSGEGLQILKDRLFELAARSSHYEPGRFVLTSARHKTELERLSDAAARAAAGLRHGQSGELVSMELRTALQHLGNITGQITTEDLLDSIFSRFCIGK